MKNPKEIMSEFHEHSNDINNMIRGLPATISLMLKFSHDDGTPYWARVEFPDRVFTHKSVEEWVKSQSRAGLGMSMAYLFKILGAHDVLKGEGSADDVRDRLAEHGVTEQKGQREKAGVLNENGRPKKYNSSNGIVKGGNNSAYLLAKLNRDNPDIAEAYANGKFRSVRAAAIAAGIVKVPTPLETAQKAFDKLDDNDRRTFLTTNRK